MNYYNLPRINRVALVPQNSDYDGHYSYDQQINKIASTLHVESLAYVAPVDMVVHVSTRTLFFNICIR